MKFLLRETLIVFLIVILPLSGAWASGASVPRDVPAGARAEAERAITDFLQTESTNRLERDGFIERGDDISRVILGRGVAEYEIMLKDALALSSGNDIMSALAFQGWSFPVFIDNNPRMLVIVGHRKGQWKWLRILPEVDSIVEARNRWQEDESCSLSFARMFTVTSFIMVREEGNYSFLSYRNNMDAVLSSGRSAPSDDQLLDPKVAIDKLERYLSRGDR